MSVEKIRKLTATEITDLAPTFEYSGMKNIEELKQKYGELFIKDILSELRHFGYHSGPLDEVVVENLLREKKLITQEQKISELGFLQLLCFWINNIELVQISSLGQAHHFLLNFRNADEKNQLKFMYFSYVNMLEYNTKLSDIVKEARTMQMFKADYETCSHLCWHLIMHRPENNFAEIISEGPITSLDLADHLASRLPSSNEIVLVALQWLVAAGGQTVVEKIKTFVQQEGRIMNAETLEEIRMGLQKYEVTRSKLVNEIFFVLGMDLCGIVADYCCL